MIEKFQVQFLDEAVEFLNNLNAKARAKIYYNIKKAQFVNDKELFNKLNDEIWEFRTIFNKTHYRLFAFWDKDDVQETLVISTHGIIKKTEKTPINELERAEKLRKEYFAEKNK